MINRPTSLLDDAFVRLHAAASQSAASPRNQLATPTQAQAKAGNYKHGFVTLHGLPIKIENDRNSTRSGVSADGKRWENRMAAVYGEFIGTTGNDGDAVDVFIGHFPESRTAWVINQGWPDGGYDEAKVMLGFATEEQARDAYLMSFDRGWTGLQSMARCTVDQLKWWLKHGDMSLPFSIDQLPDSGISTMNKTFWNADAQPVAKPLNTLMYELRVEDGAGLLLDAVSMGELLTDPDLQAAPVLDALVVEVARLTQKMNVLQRTMESAGGAVKPTGYQISDPVRARGVMQIAVLFTLSDGQTVTVWLHNPDTTPNKLMPLDELISWKWMLNKKDITIVVAPEKGRDLNIREVSRRIMRLAERNSTAFTKANAKLSEKIETDKALDGEITALTGRLSELQSQIADAKLRAEHKPAVVAVVEPVREGWRIEADAFGEGKTGYIGTRSLDNAGGIVAEKLGSWAFTRMGDSFQAIFPTGEGTYAGGDASPMPEGAYASMVKTGRWIMIQSEIAAALRPEGDPADKLAPGSFAEPAAEADPAPAADFVPSVTKQKDEFQNVSWNVELPDGSTRTIQRMDSASTMGLPGWHDDSGYLAETKADAIKALIAKYPAPAVEAAAVEPVADAAETKLTEAEARALLAWQDMGTSGGTKSHRLFFRESEGGAKMAYGEVSKEKGASKWAVDAPDGDNAHISELKAAKALAEQYAMGRLKRDGYIVADAESDPVPDADEAPAALGADWEREVIDQIAEQGEMDNSDAQGVFEAQTDVVEAQRAARADAATAAAAILAVGLVEPASVAEVDAPQADVHEHYIKIAADSIAELRKVDVDRVLGSVRADNMDGVTRESLGAWIGEKRPDLAAEVADILAELAAPAAVDPAPVIKPMPAMDPMPAIEPVADVPASPDMVALGAEPHQTDPTPLDPALAADRAYLESLIDGTGDLLAEDTFERMEPMFAKYEDNAEMSALLERAATVYGDAAVAAAQAALATPA